MTSVESYPGVRSAAAVAEQLTFLPDNFTQRVLEHREQSSFFPLSNDYNLGPSYQLAADFLPEPMPGTAGVVLVVGNGGFETATQLFPVETPIIFCDNNSRTLLLQRFMIEAMRNSPDLTSFHSAVADINHEFMMAMRNLGGRGTQGEDALYRGYMDIQDVMWGRSNVPHYSQTNAAYQKARVGVVNHSYGFHFTDFGSAASIDGLAADMRANEVSIVCANFTNVFSTHYTPRDIDSYVKQSLPFTSGAMILSSRLDPIYENLVAAAKPIESWGYSAQRII